MASTAEFAVLVSQAAPDREVSLVRLYVMRFMYLVLALGIAHGPAQEFTMEQAQKASRHACWAGLDCSRLSV